MRRTLTDVRQLSAEGARSPRRTVEVPDVALRHDGTVRLDQGGSFTENFWTAPSSRNIVSCAKYHGLTTARPLEPSGPAMLSTWIRRKRRSRSWWPAAYASRCGGNAASGSSGSATTMPAIGRRSPRANARGSSGLRRRCRLRRVLSVESTKAAASVAEQWVYPARLLVTYPAGLALNSLGRHKRLGSGAQPVSRPQPRRGRAQREP